MGAELSKEESHAGTVTLPHWAVRAGIEKVSDDLSKRVVKIGKGLGLRDDHCLTFDEYIIIVESIYKVEGNFFRLFQDDDLQYFRTLGSLSNAESAKKLIENKWNEKAGIDVLNSLLALMVSDTKGFLLNNDIAPHKYLCSAPYMVSQIINGMRPSKDIGGILTPEEWVVVQMAYPDLPSLNQPTSGFNFRKLLYSSTKHGTGSTIMHSKIIYYSGPSFLVIEDDVGSKYCALINRSLMETTSDGISERLADRYGYFRSFICKLERASEGKSQITFCMEKGGVSKSLWLNYEMSSFRRGLGIGEYPSCQLFLDADTDRTEVLSLTSTYTQIPLLASGEYKHDFQAAGCEIWGLGDYNSLEDKEFKARLILEQQRGMSTGLKKRIMDDLKYVNERG